MASTLVLPNVSEEYLAEDKEDVPGIGIYRLGICPINFGKSLTFLSPPMEMVLILDEEVCILRTQLYL